MNFFGNKIYVKKTSFKRRISNFFCLGSEGNVKDMEGELKGAVLGAEEGVRGVGEGVEAAEGGKDTKE